MKQLSNESEIWCLSPSKEDLIQGANYAAITLPWTFNRMMKNTSTRGQQERGLNIAKGIVVQEVLKREFDKHGVTAILQRKSHRDNDLFDFKLRINGVLTKLDLKSIHYYTNYQGDIRPPFTTEYLIANKDYYGSKWSKFFPMLIAHTQIEQSKESYCFAITSSIDMRRNIVDDRIQDALTAFPYGVHLGFFSSRSLCLSREEHQKGFYIDCAYLGEGSLFDRDMIDLEIIGEWNNSIQRYPITLSRGEIINGIGPFSCLSSFQIDRESYSSLTGTIQIDVADNELKQPVLNSLKTDTNIVPNEPFFLSKGDFCNLILPNDFKVYYLGWIVKSDFIEKCKKYVGWVWPQDSVSKYDNQPWDQITEKDYKRLSSLGFGECIQKKPSLLKAGWLKTSGFGSGGCCYVFPNMYGGGVKETNLYVLPSDLNPMELLIS